MGELELRWHNDWLNMVTPVEGLVFSAPVLVDAQCFERHPPSLQRRFKELCTPEEKTGGRGTSRKKADEPAETDRVIQDLPTFLSELLELRPALFDAADGYGPGNEWAGVISRDLSVYAAEGGQTIRPTLALRRLGAPREVTEADGALAQLGAGYEMLVWEVPNEVDLNRPETVTGPWLYPPTAKLERLLRAARVPIGLISNGRALRLIYAPHGEATGHLDFRLTAMWDVIGRPVLDAMVMLLHANRFFGVTEERSLPALLQQSRRYQANVTNELGEQVFEALTVLLRGFEAAAERDGHKQLEEALARENDHLYQGLLTVLLRIVFVLYAEDRGLMPVEHALYQEHYSLFSLYERLQADYGEFPDSMSRRFGAWGQLLALFRAIYQGAAHGKLEMPARRGTLFNPNVFAFIEGWDAAGTAPIDNPAAQAALSIPTIDDETIYRVLSKLIMLDGQRLSYKTLDVEQVGSIYELLLGFHVARVEHRAVRMRPEGVWLTAEEVLAVPAARRKDFLAEHTGLAKAQAQKLADALSGTKRPEAAYEALLGYGIGRTQQARAESSCAQAGQLVLQPGKERRRTSSHYTPRSLSSKVVDRTLEPLLKCMTEEGQDGPSSKRILQLRICDPAMGSGAFLVEACRYLGDALVAAWTREGAVSHHRDPELAARRRIAQCCLYGVDKNPAAVELAKLSLWLITLSKNRPFTFLDGNLRHGDSLVGLSLDQLRAFHWKPTDQRGFAEMRIEETLKEAIDRREELRELAQKENGFNPDPSEKQILLRDADDALERLRLIGDVCIGAFFACDKDAAREKERLMRLDLVEKWLAAGSGRATKLESELRELQAELRQTQVPFHWMIEFTDVFWDKRPDPLNFDGEEGVAYIDAFVGNPPFSGKNGISELGGTSYIPWLQVIHEGAHGNSDLAAHFFRRADALLGKKGTIGFIATNTISQGDTRDTGLKPLLEKGETIQIYYADTDRKWSDFAPVKDHGSKANVTVSIVQLAKVLRSELSANLNGLRCAAINSQLKASEDRNDPAPLASNTKSAFVGTYVLGKGFLLTPDERQSLVAKNRRNAQRVFPYLGGEEVNTSPEQAFHRYVISFGQMDLAEAEQWPDLLNVVRENVKPERDKLKDNADGRDYKARWWQFAKIRKGMDEAIAPLSRCLVTSRVTKHLCFSFQPTDRIFSEQLYAFALDKYAPFAVLQSRIHEAWARLLSSSMKTDLRYAASDCFETFPFPQPDPRTPLPKLEKLGEKLYEARAKYMVDTQQGLTKTYNALKDPSCTDKRILSLREMHEAMDEAVLLEYGWDNSKVPPFCPQTDADTRAVEKFKSQVIDALYELNAERAEHEALMGETKKGAKAKRVRADNHNAAAQKKPTGKLKGDVRKSAHPPERKKTVAKR